MLVIFISDDLVFPTLGGGRVEILWELQALREAGIRLGLIVTHREVVQDEIREAHAELSDVPILWHRREGYIRTTLKRPTLPYVLASRHVPARRVRRWLQEIGEPPDAIIASHEWSMGVAQTVAELGNHPIVLRSHNDEFAYFANLKLHAQGITRAYYRLELCRFRTMSRLAHSAEEVWTICADDLSAYVAHPCARVVPPPVPAGHTLDSGLRNRPMTVGFLGSLDQPHTVEDIKWFATEVFPKMRRTVPEASLVVAGRNPSPDVALAIAGLEGVTFVGQIADPSEFYENLRVFVNPARSGSGINLKVLDPARLSVPVISTSFGLRGLEILRAAPYNSDSAEDLARIGRELLLDDAARRAAVTAGHRQVNALKAARVGGLMSSRLQKLGERHRKAF